jgi:hypothetical protein
VRKLGIAVEGAFFRTDGVEVRVRVVDGWLLGVRWLIWDFTGSDCRGRCWRDTFIGVWLVLLCSLKALGSDRLDCVSFRAD